MLKCGSWLVSVAIVGLVFALALFLPHKIQGWTFYLSTAEVIFEVAVRVLFTALAGVALASICTVFLVPFLWYFDPSRERLVEWTSKVLFGGIPGFQVGTGLSDYLVEPRRQIYRRIADSSLPIFCRGPFHSCFATAIGHEP